MFSIENSNMYGYEEKKERKKVIKMKDMFEIPQGSKEKIGKKEAVINKKLDKEKKDLPKGKADTRISELKKNMYSKKPMVKA